MSRKYKKSSEVPIKDLCKRLEELSDAVTKGNKGWQEFTMRVPAEVDRDADLVMSEASTRLEKLESKIQELEAAIRYTTDYLAENKLNSIGNGSKAHNELMSALREGELDE